MCRLEEYGTAHTFTFQLALCGVSQRKKSPLILFLLLVCEIILTVVAAMLWVAVGFQVGLQKSEFTKVWIDHKYLASWLSEHQLAKVTYFQLSKIMASTLDILCLTNKRYAASKTDLYCRHFAPWATNLVH